MKAIAFVRCCAFVHSFHSILCVIHKFLYWSSFFTIPPQLLHLFVGRCTFMQYAVIQSSSDIASHLAVFLFISLQLDQLERRLCMAHPSLYIALNKTCNTHRHSWYSYTACLNQTSRIIM